MAPKIERVEYRFTPGMAALAESIETGTTSPTPEPSDPRALRREHVADFDPLRRVGNVLGAEFTPRLRGALAAGSVGDLLDLCADLESAARRLRRELDRCEQTAEKGASMTASATQAEAAKKAAHNAQQAAETADRQLLADRLSRARIACEQAALALDVVRGYDGSERRDTYRVITSDAAHPLLPDRFERPAERAALHVFIRGASRMFVLPGSAGSLEHVERWLARRVGFEP